MRCIFAIFILVSLAVISPVALASGGCPNGADNLQSYSSCLAQVGGGAVYRGTMASLDPDHQRLMAAMERTNVVPPQVIPALMPYGYYPSAANMSGWAMWSAVGYVAAARNAGSPYFWLYAGYRPIY